MRRIVVDLSHPERLVSLAFQDGVLSFPLAWPTRIPVLAVSFLRPKLSYGRWHLSAAFIAPTGVLHMRMLNESRTTISLSPRVGCCLAKSYVAVVPSFLVSSSCTRCSSPFAAVIPTFHAVSERHLHGPYFLGKVLLLLSHGHARPVFLLRITSPSDSILRNTLGFHETPASTFDSILQAGETAKTREYRHGKDAYAPIDIPKSCHWKNGFRSRESHCLGLSWPCDYCYCMSCCFAVQHISYRLPRCQRCCSSLPTASIRVPISVDHI